MQNIASFLTRAALPLRCARDNYLTRRWARQLSHSTVPNSAVLRFLTTVLDIALFTFSVAALIAIALIAF